MPLSLHRLPKSAEKQRQTNKLQISHLDFNPTACQPVKDDHVTYVAALKQMMV